MYLKSLTLKGFKSFAKPTTFAFEPGVTCVVGPNGSGKSNIVDALSWVMGEQGAKTLRGGKMDDVIFAGTSSQGPLGRAEVSLTIDNSDGVLPIDYSEVSVSRVLFRNGSSEYAINGEPCRLLDVHELLSDSGLGRQMHVIVGQGRLDSVLHASPDDRRGFIEDAAGILKYRRRKEKTLRKLDAMHANMTRLNDIVAEVRKQLKPLGRQATIARQADAIAAIARDAKARLLADDILALRSIVANVSATESEHHMERVLITEQLEQRQQAIAALEADQRDAVLDEAKRVCFDLEQVRERIRSIHMVAQERLVQLSSDDEGEFRPTITPDEIDSARAQVATLTEAFAAAEAEWSSRRDETIQLREKRDALDRELDAQSGLISQYDLELSRRESVHTLAASQLAGLRDEYTRNQIACEQSRDRLDTARHEHSLLETRDGGDQAGAQLDDAYLAAEATLQSEEQKYEAARESLHAHEREHGGLCARIDVLSSALDLRNVAQSLVDVGGEGIRGLVASTLQVKPGYEVALAAALGALAEAVLVDDFASGLALLERAETASEGRFDIVIARASNDVDQREAPDDLVFATAVADMPAGVHALLALTFIADTDEAAVHAVSSGIFSRIPGATIVTRAGNIFASQVLRGGSDTTQSRIELLAEHERAMLQRDTLGALIDRDRAAVADRREHAQKAKEACREAMQALRTRDAQTAALREELRSARVKEEAARADHERLVAASDATRMKIDEAERVCATRVREWEEIKNTPRPEIDVSDRDALSEKIDCSAHNEVQSLLAFEALREKIRAAKSYVDDVERQREREQKRAREVQERVRVRRQRIENAQAVLEKIPFVLVSVETSVRQARHERDTLESARSERNEQLAAGRREEATLRERLSALTEKVHGIELHVYEKKENLRVLRERAVAELGLDEDTLIAEYGPDQRVILAESERLASARSCESTGDGDESGHAVLYVREEQERRRDQATKRLAQLGTVNPLALEEFGALEQRHTFLTEQIADLSKTRKDLLSIVTEIDERMVTVFVDAFDDVRNAFAEVFPVLFPGGTGKISLTEPDDLLTTGIDISVRPAGKRVERLSLLSGGERSLVAAAFLIAIFKARPSPFYIMDEVEAALDDANLGRLLTVFEDLRSSSQLIIVTHQKRTMDIADVLYGVSMRQDGVSSVVGQRLCHLGESVREEVAS